MSHLFWWLVWLLLLAGQSSRVQPVPTDVRAPGALPKPAVVLPADRETAATQFPLAPGTRWVYSREYYAPSDVNPRQIVTATFILTETVVEVVQDGAAIRALVHTDEEPVYIAPDYSMETDFEARDFWYVLDGNRVYQLTDVSAPGEEAKYYSKLLYDFPIALQKSWCPGSPDSPDACKNAGMRVVVETGPISVPAGEFPDCYRTHEFYNSGGPFIWFCTGVGIVDEQYDHGGTPFGDHSALIDYYSPQK